MSPFLMLLFSHNVNTLLCSHFSALPKWFTAAARERSTEANERGSECKASIDGGWGTARPKYLHVSPLCPEWETL